MKKITHIGLEIALLLVGLLDLGFLFITFSGWPFFFGIPQSSSLDNLLANVVSSSLIGFLRPAMILFVITVGLIFLRYGYKRRYMMIGLMVVLVAYVFGPLPRVISNVNSLTKTEGGYLKLLG